MPWITIALMLLAQDAPAASPVGQPASSRAEQDDGQHEERLSPRAVGEAVLPGALPGSAAAVTSAQGLVGGWFLSLLAASVVAAASIMVLQDMGVSSSGSAGCYGTWLCGCGVGAVVFTVGGGVTALLVTAANVVAAWLASRVLTRQRPPAWVPVVAVVPVSLVALLLPVLLAVPFLILGVAFLWASFAPSPGGSFSFDVSVLGDFAFIASMVVVCAGQAFGALVVALATGGLTYWLGRHLAGSPQAWEAAP